MLQVNWLQKIYDYIEISFVQKLILNLTGNKIQTGRKDIKVIKNCKIYYFKIIK